MSFSIIKFFDTNAPESNGGTSTEAPSSIASLMAKSGVVNRTETPVATPINTTENKESPAPASEAPPATGTAQSAETGKTESPSPTTETKVEPQKETPQQLNWQEVLKSQQPDTILKELGFDDKTIGFLKGKKGIDEKMLNFLNHWETNNGDVTKYLQELSTDYSKMPATEVMRHQLREEYPKATEKQIDALFKKQVLDFYKIDPNLYSEDEVAEGQLLLEAVADKHRDKFVANQQQYLMSKPQQKEEGPDLELQEASNLYNSYKQTFDNHSSVKDLLSNKTLALGTGDEAYKLPIPYADEIINNIQDTLATYISIGKINKENISQLPPDFIENQIHISAFSKNPKAYHDALAEHYKTIGAKKAIEQIENAKKPSNEQTAKAEVSTDNPAAAMAKGGRIVSGGY